MHVRRPICIDMYLWPTLVCGCVSMRACINFYTSTCIRVYVCAHEDTLCGLSNKPRKPLETVSQGFQIEAQKRGNRISPLLHRSAASQGIF